ncbi:hypothetical protein QQZ08_004028 [Neonectria magnoliae]|uniref:Uncharacterized protein n=1 Tax=Neonectria magnoliae TaxID=2732573 RepID=A0ABR1I9C4_9HYPO
MTKSLEEPSTSSLRSSLLEFQEENGRTYHRMSEGKYIYPNDDRESERLDLQDSLVPPNCKFEIDDLEKEWTWKIPFDYVFSRMMTGSFASPEAMTKKVFENLALFTRILSWTKEDVMALCAEVRKELRNPRVHGYWKTYIIYG